MKRLKSYKRRMLILFVLMFGLVVLPQLSTAAKLTNWDGTTARVTLTNKELSDSRSDGLLGPGKKTYSIVDNQIDTSNILRSSKIVSDLKKKNLKPETYFDTKCPFYLRLIYPSKYRDRIAWDVWIHAQAAKGVCIPIINQCLRDPSPGTIGFNEWFVTDAGGNID